MSLLGHYLTIRLQQHSSGSVNEVIAETTSVNATFTAEALESTDKDSGLNADFVVGKNKVTISGDWLAATDNEQFENLFTHANDGDKIEVQLYRSGNLWFDSEGVLTSLSDVGANSDSLTTGAYSMEVDASALGAIWGSELNTTANAVSDPAGAEANAITGWGQNNLNGTGSNVFESQSGTVSVGAYAFHANANDTPTSNALIYLDLSAAPYSFTNGEEGKIEYNRRHVGTGDGWVVNMGALYYSNTGVIDSIGSGETAFTSNSHEFTYSADTKYLIVREQNASNNGGVYFDNLSIKKKN